MVCSFLFTFPNKIFIGKALTYKLCQAKLCEMFPTHLCVFCMHISYSCNGNYLKGHNSWEALYIPNVYTFGSLYLLLKKMCCRKC